MTILSGKPGTCSQADSLRRLAWDIAEWSYDPPLLLNTDDQRKLATTLNAAANTIDKLTGTSSAHTTDDLSYDSKCRDLAEAFLEDTQLGADAPPDSLYHHRWEIAADALAARIQEAIEDWLAAPPRPFSKNETRLP